MQYTIGRLDGLDVDNTTRVELDSYAMTTRKARTRLGDTWLLDKRGRANQVGSLSATYPRPFPTVFPRFQPSRFRNGLSPYSFALRGVAKLRMFLRRCRASQRCVGLTVVPVGVNTLSFAFSSPPVICYNLYGYASCRPRAPVPAPTHPAFLRGSRALALLHAHVGRPCSPSRAVV